MRYGINERYVLDGDYSLNGNANVVLDCIYFTDDDKVDKDDIFFEIIKSVIDFLSSRLHTMSRGQKLRLLADILDGGTLAISKNESFTVIYTPYDEFMTTGNDIPCQTKQGA